MWPYMEAGIIVNPHNGFFRAQIMIILVLPVAQIKLLKLLALLGAGDQGASENMYQVVAMTMREGAKHGNTIGNALVYEAVRTVTAIYPNPTLLQQGELLPRPYSILLFPYASSCLIAA